MKHTVLLLGATGMLGSMLLDVFSQEAETDLTATVRSATRKKQLEEQYPKVTFLLFDAEKDSFDSFFKKIKKPEWIVNAVGIIKPFIHDDNEEEVKKAYRINTVFPSLVTKAIDQTSIKVIQIATDCVYSGEKGNYTEDDMHDPTDIYGKTKSLGEVLSPHVIHLRVSIIGPESGTKNSLLEWFLHQEKNANISGFTNHRWNGITTLHFAKICVGMMRNDITLHGIQHVVPSDSVTKARLVEIFAKIFERKDIHVTKTKAKETIDRTLSTLHGKINTELWRAAGYKKPPTIEKMVAELAQYTQQKSL